MDFRPRMGWRSNWGRMDLLSSYLGIVLVQRLKRLFAVQLPPHKVARLQRNLRLRPALSVSVPHSPSRRRLKGRHAERLDWRTRRERRQRPRPKPLRGSSRTLPFTSTVSASNKPVKRAPCGRWTEGAQVSRRCPTFKGEHLRVLVSAFRLEGRTGSSPINESIYRASSPFRLRIGATCADLMKLKRAVEAVCSLDAVNIPPANRL